MNAIIIDDEKNGAEVLRLLLQRVCPHVQLLEVVHSAADGIETIRRLRPELIFLDIEMPMATGFDVYEATKDCNYEIIFTTAYEHYALKAFKTEAIDYLLKPVDIEELQVAVSKAGNRLLAKTGGRQASPDIAALFKNITLASRKITIPTSEGVLLVAASDIVYLESDSNYTNIFLKDGRKILVSKTLKLIEKQFLDCNFCRVHSAYLVNLDEVERYIKGDGGTLVLRNHSSVPVSRAHKQELMRRIGFV
jgi:two-component system LytT family response regulator